MEDQPPLLEVRGISHRFGEQRILNDVNLSVGKGEVVTLLGESGCGKTTLLRIIAGLSAPATGSVLLEGESVTREGKVEVPPEKRRVGFVFQDFPLFPALNVETNIGFGVARAERSQRAAELLKLIGLESLASRKPRELSGGQRQRVALAQALAPHPRLVLLDEPFSNVDGDQRASLGAEAIAFVTAQQASVLLVTHDRSEALSLADRVAVAVIGEEGTHIAQIDSPNRIYREPASRAVASLTGVASFIKANAEGSIANSAMGGAKLREPTHGAATLMIRPDQVRFEASEAGEFEIADTRFLGHSWLLDCRHGAVQVRVEWKGDSAPPKGTKGAIHAKEALWALPDQGD